MISTANPGAVVWQTGKYPADPSGAPTRPRLPRTSGIRASTGEPGEIGQRMPSTLHALPVPGPGGPDGDVSKPSGLANNG